MKDAKEYVDRLVDAGMEKDRAEEAVAEILKSGLPINFMVDALIIKIRGPRTTIVEVKNDE